MTLARPDDIDLVNLDHIIANYNSEIDRCLATELTALEERLWARICRFESQIDPDTDLTQHLQRISRNGAHFLKHLGFSAKVAENFRRACLFSKLGYLHQDNAHKGFGSTGPVTINDQKTARMLADHGREILADAIAGLSGDCQTHPHIRVVIPALMQFHHECINGCGPFERTGTDMGIVIRVMVIADSHERQFCSHIGGTIPETPIEAIDYMCGANSTSVNQNIFDRKLLEAYARFQARGNHTRNARDTIYEMATETA